MVPVYHILSYDSLLTITDIPEVILTQVAFIGPEMYSLRNVIPFPSNITQEKTQGGDPFRSPRLSFLQYQLLNDRLPSLNDLSSCNNQLFDKLISPPSFVSFNQLTANSCEDALIPLSIHTIAEQCSFEEFVTYVTG